MYRSKNEDDIIIMSKPSQSLGSKGPLYTAEHLFTAHVKRDNNHVEAEWERIAVKKELRLFGITIWSITKTHIVTAR